MNPLGIGQADRAAVEALVRASGTSFYQGMRILPADRRLAMYAIYGFCRLVDDIADEEAPIADKRAGLDRWRGAIAGVFAGRTGDAVTRALLPAVQRFNLRQADFAAVIDGMQMDAETVIVAPDLATLDVYCDRVAGAVGRLSVRAFGDESAEADRVAHYLGRALQLTNILRDVTEDAARGRLYLPAEWLESHRVPADPHAALAAPGLPAVCARVATMAHGHFADAQAAMARCDPRAMKPARLMGATYAAILRRVQQAGFPAPARARLPAWQKLALAARYGLL